MTRRAAESRTSRGRVGAVGPRGRGRVGRAAESSTSRGWVGAVGPRTVTGGGGWQQMSS